MDRLLMDVMNSKANMRIADCFLRKLFYPKLSYHQPDELLSEGQLPLVFSLLQFIPGPVDVRDHLALCGQVGLLVVCPHLALNGEQLHLQVTFLYKSGYTKWSKYIHICFSLEASIELILI